MAHSPTLLPAASLAGEAEQPPVHKNSVTFPECRPRDSQNLCKPKINHLPLVPVGKPNFDDVTLTYSRK